MLVTYKQCDLCNSRINRFSNELNIKYKAKINTPKYFSIEDVKDRILISSEWENIDVCENCLKDFIRRKHENNKE